MAVSLADIAVAFNVLFPTDALDQVARTAFLPRVMPAREHTEGQKVISVPVRLGGHANARVSSGAAVHRTNDFDTSNVVAVTSQSWARYEGFAQIDGLARDLARSNKLMGRGGSLEANISGLVRQELFDAIKDLTSVIGADFYTGNPTASPPELAGLDAICTTGTFAGINPATTNQGAWAAVDATGSLASLSPKYIRDNLIEPFRTASNKDPEFITCPGAVWTALADAIEAAPGSRAMYSIQRGEGGNADQDSVYAKLVGTRYIEVEGIPIVKDSAAPANTLYAIHRDGCVLEYVKPVPELTEGVMEAMAAILGVSGLEPASAQQMVDQRGAGKLVPSIIALGNEGDFQQLMAVLRMQLRVERRNHFGRLVLS